MSMTVTVCQEKNSRESFPHEGKAHVAFLSTVGRSFESSAWLERVSSSGRAFGEFHARRLRRLDRTIFSFMHRGVKKAWACLALQQFSSCRYDRDGFRRKRERRRNAAAVPLIPFPKPTPSPTVTEHSSCIVLCVWLDSAWLSTHLVHLSNDDNYT